VKANSNWKTFLLILLPVTAISVALLGCGSSITGGSTQPASNPGPAFVVGTDAPAAGVVSFAVQIESLTATDSNNNTVQLLSGTPTVDFARFNGLNALLDFNDVQAGTYTSVTATFGTATIGYLNQVAGSAPTIQTMNATLTSNSVTVDLANPMVVAAGSPVGLHVDFDLRKSIQVDGTGNITGSVTPTFDVKAVNNSDPGAYVDCFDAGVLSVNANAGTFTIQGPHGRHWTVNTSGTTEWENGETINDLTTSSIVRISGPLDRADATFDADSVAILSQDGFFAEGPMTYVNPAPGTGAATNFNFYVGGVLPSTSGLTLGEIANVQLGGSEKYFIDRHHGELAQYLFNSSLLLPGQRISVGGPASGATNPAAVTVKRVVLHLDGYNGTVGATNSGNDTFTYTVKGFKGLLIPQTVTVVTTDKTDYRGGLTGFGDITASMNVRVVGLLLEDPTSGNTVLLAHYVDELQ
jgi:hypothetical protein